MNNYTMFSGEDELTGLEEHLRDEAYECGEVAAMRREAEEFHRMEAAIGEAEQREWEEEDARLNPFGRCVMDDPTNRGLFPRMCETSGDEDIPF
jgi:hypothetical protein